MSLYLSSKTCAFENLKFAQHWSSLVNNFPNQTLQNRYEAYPNSLIYVNQIITQILRCRLYLNNMPM